MSRHAETALLDRLGEVVGLTDAEARRLVEAHNAELLNVYTNGLTERIAELRYAWTDDEGKVDDRVAPVFKLALAAILQQADEAERVDR